MSQSESSTADTQVLLQSMLQRLKLQSGREGQAHLQPTEPKTAASEPGQDGERGAYDLQAFGRENNIPVNGFVPEEQGKDEHGTNGIPLKMHDMRKWDSSEEFGISEWDNGFGQAAFSFKGRGKQERQSGHGYKMNEFPISFSSHKDIIKSGIGENGILGQDTPTGTGLIPVKSLKDADVTSFERTKDEIQGERGSHSGPTIIPGKDTFTTAVGQIQDHDQSFKPRVYAWSLQTTEENLDTENGNGGVGAWANSTDTQIGMAVFSQQQAANNPLRRKDKYRLSDNKAKRWTQKLKERWRDRPGSFMKKGQGEGGRIDMKSEQETESSQHQLLITENLINTSIKEDEESLLTLDGSDQIDSLPTLTEDCTNEGNIRSNSDFELGLGSFSLLEEILTGQEWAKFLNPTPQTLSANQGVSEEPASQLRNTRNLQNQDGGQSSLASIQQRGWNYQWSFTGSESSQNIDFGAAPTSADVCKPTSMEISEGNHVAAKNVHSEADQSEPMEPGHTQSDTEPEESRIKQVGTPGDFSFVKPAEILDNSALKSRVHLNRKRVHESTERTESLQIEKTDDRKETDRDGSIFSPSLINNHGTGGTGEVEHNNIMPLESFWSLSPFPSAPARRGVLKHSISQDSESSMSMETLTKKRRLEDNRRVHFSEEVIAIEPPEQDLETDSEEDSGTEEDSVIEEGAGLDQEEMEELMVPARRPALPGWIRALKRRNTGRKHRQ